VLISSVSAATQLNIYLDERGDALFLGDTNEHISLPQGVTLEGEIISGKTSTLTSKQGEEWKFSYGLDNSEITVILPQNAVLDSYNDGEIFLERGQIAISDGEFIEVRYHIEDNESSLSLWIIVAIIVLLLVYFYLKKKTKSQSKFDKKQVIKEIDKLRLVEGVLNDRERLIINELKALKHAKMSYLRKQTDIPKAAFSRHVHELERKKLVKLEGEGKNKFVSLR
jgi:uncharacterized membrane protein